MRLSRRERALLNELIDFMPWFWSGYHKPKPKPKPKVDYKKLMDEATTAKSNAEKNIKSADDEGAKIAAEVNLSSAQMEEEVKKARAIKSFEAILAKKEKYTEAIKTAEENIQKYKAKL